MLLLKQTDLFLRLARYAAAQDIDSLDQYNKFYWSPSKKEAIPSGFLVPGMSSRDDEVSSFVEQIFEEVRQEKYPDKPSRIGAKFASGGIYNTFIWAEEFKRKNKTRSPSPSRPIFEVKIEGNAANVDGFWINVADEYAGKAFQDVRSSSFSDVYFNQFTDRVNPLWRKDCEHQLKRCANNYWSGCSVIGDENLPIEQKTLPEILIQGTVTVVKQVTIPELSKELVQENEQHKMLLAIRALLDELLANKYQSRQECEDAIQKQLRDLFTIKISNIRNVNTSSYDVKFDLILHQNEWRFSVPILLQRNWVDGNWQILPSLSSISSSNI